MSIVESLGPPPDFKSIDFLDEDIIIPGFFTGMKHNEESKKIMSERAKARGNDLWIGRTHKDDSKKKMSLSKQGTSNAAKSWVVTHPDGREEYIYNMEKFCREKGIQASNLHKVTKGLIKQHKGYQLRHG